MALIKHGDDGLFIQPDRTISEKEDGTLSGSVLWEGDASEFFPFIGNSHPDDSRLELVESTRTVLRNNKVQVQASYFGLVSSTTVKRISYTGAQNQEAIEVHEDFESFAGNGDTPINGARFETDEGADGEEFYNFLGFYPGVESGARNEFTGVTSFLKAGTSVSVTYWSDRVPRLGDRMTIIKKITGFTTPDDVGDFLLLDTPYRQVGSFYQVTEQYLGSGKRGWNAKIYK